LTFHALQARAVPPPPGCNASLIPYGTPEKPANINPDPRLRLERTAYPLQLGFSDYEQINAKKGDA
jgi:hypothetical protein